MTTIVYRSGVLAADTQSTRGGSIEPIRRRKVFRLRDGRLFAWCGDVGMGERVRSYLDNPKANEKPEPTGDQGGAILVDRAGMVWNFENGALASIEHAPFFAIGSGRSEAYGALAMGASAVKAVRVAARFDNSTGGVVQWLRLR